MGETMSTKREGRIVYYDVLNVVACFGVVAMHFNGLVHAYSPTWGWAQALAVDCLFYWAVPVFFMLSGATLMDYRDRYDTKEFLIKRVKRTLVPFVVWSLVVLIWKVSHGLMEPPVGPRSLIDMVLNTKIIDIYWFFIPLFMVYLSLPVLSLLRDKKRILRYMALVGVVLNVALPFFSKVVGITWNAQATFPVLGGYLVYVLIGYLLRDERLSKRSRAAIYLLGIAGVLVRYLHTLFASLSAGAIVELTWGYTSLPCLLESVAVFVFARQVRWERLFGSDRAKSRLSKVAGCSFGIYLIHMIVFQYGLWLTGLNGGDVEWRLIGPFVAYGVSFAIIWVMRHVPVLRTIVP